MLFDIRMVELQDLVDLTFDQNSLDKFTHESLILTGFVTVFYFGCAVHHTITTCRFFGVVGNTTPMFCGESVFKSEYFEHRFPVGPFHIVMKHDKFTVFKRPDGLDLWCWDL